MDAFVSDVLDMPVPYDRYVNDGKLNLTAVLRSPILCANLAFHDAWLSAVGVRPTRIDFLAFSQLAGVVDSPHNSSMWNGISAVNALRLFIGTKTGLQVSYNVAQLVDGASSIYQKSIASYSSCSLSNDTTLLMINLLTKLRDRFGSCNNYAATEDEHEHEHEHDVSMLPVTYTKLVLRDRSLQLLEQWISSGSDMAWDPPKGVSSYYERVAKAAMQLGLPSRCPVTGFAIDVSLSSSLSAIEHLRYPIAHNLYLWRCDIGGSILISTPNDDSGSACIADLDVNGCFTHRHVRGPPPALLLASLPAFYSHILVDVGGGGILPMSTSMSKVRQGEIISIRTESIGGACRLIEQQQQQREIVISGSPPPAGAFWLPAAGTCFGAKISPPSWSALLSKSMLIHQMQPQSGASLLHQFVSRYAFKRSLGSCVFVTAPPGKRGITGELVLIDNRPNVWSVMSILITLDNLKASDWSVVVFCSNANKSFMRDMLLPHVPHASIEVLNELNTPNGVGFDIENYNRLLKSPALWRLLIGVPRVLLVQDDGLLIRPGLDGDSAILTQDYVGAPWPKEPKNYRDAMEKIGVDPESMVGNGGLCLRNPEVMLELCETEKDGLARSLFNHGLQPIPEDVFFATALVRSGRPAPSREAATRFSFEMMVPPVDGPVPYGLHKPWPYMSAKVLDGILSGVLSNVMTRE